MKIVGPTVFVGVYGAFRTYPWVDGEQQDSDAYSVFAARAITMGWSSPHADGSALWGMNDAGQNWSTAHDTQVAWFQVGTADPPHDRVPLPVQPILACVRDSLSRFGRLDMSAVQLLLPVHLGGSAIERLVSGLTWFDTSDPAAQVPVLVTLDSGEDDAVSPAAPGMLAALRRTNTGPFRIDTLLADATPVAPEPPVVGDMWLGTSRHPVTFGCTVPEWSLDAVGWLAALFADACRGAGVRTTVLVSVARTPSDR